jgi:hypothetical protein
VSYLRLVARGWIMVALVSLNTIQVAHGRNAAAIAVGFLISLTWWSNSSKQREDVRGAGLAYATGAALGTMTGMWLGGLSW